MEAHNRLSSRALGQIFESAAAQSLARTGAELICLNWRNKFGEIDLIYWDKGVLCIGEVKSAESSLLRALEKVNGVKQAQLKKMAALFLAERFPGRWPAVRFDVFAFAFQATPLGPRPLEQEWIKNAFY